MSKILVVIPTIIEHPYKYILLDQLVREPLVAQIVVVDNGNCFEILKGREKKWKKVEIIRPGCNLNWLASCNLGATLMLERKLPYVCFLNDDVSISNCFFDGMIRTFSTFPKPAMVAPLYNGYYSQDAICIKNKEEWKPENFNCKVPYVDGTCLLIARSTIETVGLLDPIFREPGWGAETDYAYRIYVAGLKIFVCRASKIWHVHRRGGTSARIIYGNEENWQKIAIEQLLSCFLAKYKKNADTKLDKWFEPIFSQLGISFDTADEPDAQKEKNVT